MILFLNLSEIWSVPLKKLPMFQNREQRKTFWDKAENYLPKSFVACTVLQFLQLPYG